MSSERCLFRVVGTWHDRIQWSVCTLRYGFSVSSSGWHPFVDGLRSTETVAGKPASATRTPTSVTSYTTDFISLRYVSRRDVGCRKPTASFSSFNILTTISLPPPSHGPSFSQFNPLALGWPAWRTRKAAGWREDSDEIDPRKVRLPLSTTLSYAFAWYSKNKHNGMHRRMTR